MSSSSKKNSSRCSTIDGFAAPGWERVASVFSNLVEKGALQGAAYAVYHKGELVVNLAGGYADDEDKVTWKVNTLCQAFSATKGVMAVVMAMLVDRGLLSYKEQVATYWPEFAQNGKNDVTVEQLLSHQAGLAAIDEPISGLGDPDERAQILARQKPNWPLGEKRCGYHALTIGLYMEELLRRVDPQHRDARHFFEEEVAQKFDVDMQMGLGDADIPRISQVCSEKLSIWQKLQRVYNHWDLRKMLFAIKDKQSLIYRAATNPIQHKLGEPKHPNDPDYRRMTNPSALGYCSAEGMAKFWSIVANGGEREGKRLVSQRRLLEMLAEELVEGIDQVLLHPCSYGRGTSPSPPPDGREGVIIGTPGAGGQMGYADMQRHLSWGYVTNHHILGYGTRNPVYLSLLSATYQVVDELNAKARAPDGGTSDMAESSS